MTGTPNSLVIQDEAQVYDLLQRYVTNPLDVADLSLTFAGWPSLKIHLEGPEFDQTITPAMMELFLQLQKGVYQTYAQTCYGVSRRRVLTASEREALQINVKVMPGSSGYWVNFERILGIISTGIVDKMEPAHVVATILGVAGLWFCRSTFLGFMESRKQQLAMEKASIRTQFLSEQETRRFELMTQVVSQVPDLQPIREKTEEYHQSVLKAMATAQKIEYQGITIQPGDARLLSQTVREKSTEVRLDGQFRILRVDSADPTQFKVKVQHQETGEELDAVVQDDSLDQHNRPILQAAEWQRQPVSLKINARQLRGQYKDATIIEVIRVAD